MGREDGARDALERISDLKCPGKDSSWRSKGFIGITTARLSREGQKCLNLASWIRRSGQTRHTARTALFGAAARHTTVQEEREGAAGCQGWGLREQTRLPSGPNCLPTASY